jgi:hypothetical protein
MDVLEIKANATPRGAARHWTSVWTTGDFPVHEQAEPVHGRQLDRCQQRGQKKTAISGHRTRLPSGSLVSFWSVAVA